jgi:hypothetical protein
VIFLPFEPNPPLSGLASVTGAWSMNRLLVPGFSAAFCDTVTGASRWRNQAVAGEDFVQSNTGKQPSIATGIGPTGKAALRFDGSDDGMFTGSAISTFFSSTAGVVIAAAIVRAVTSNDANSWTNDSVWQDSASFVGTHLKTAPGSGSKTVLSYGFDSADRKASTVITDANLIDAVNVFMWRHESSNVYGSVNGGTEDSAALGTVGGMTGVLFTGGVTVGTQIDIFEMVSFSTPPSSGTLAALIADMRLYYRGS